MAATRLFFLEIRNPDKFPLLAGASLDEILEFHLQIVNVMSKMFNKKDPPTYFIVPCAWNG
jgi:hypothetical protein